MILKKGQFILAENKWNNDQFEGVVKSVEGDTVTIQTTDGKEKVIDLLQFIVIVLPLLDKIVDWVGRTWRKIFKRK